jgi:hypothetical protein
MGFPAAGRDFGRCGERPCHHGEKSIGKEGGSDDVADCVHYHYRVGWDNRESVFRITAHEGDAADFRGNQEFPAGKIR